MIRTTTTDRSTSRAVAAALVSVCLGFAALPCTAQAAEDEIIFNRDIRPILSENCFACHGPDEKGRQAGLRLDLAEAAQAETDSGARPIVAGRPEESELVRRIMSHDPDKQMPPPTSQWQLNDVQRDLLRRWIAAGATYQPHWSFVPPRRLNPPQIAAEERVRNPIDAFVLSRLEAQRLSLAPDADKATLLRRVSLDLTGLPPTLDELDAFLSDDAPDAYERVVDRLLDSPRYGERMALEWLDAARYADTNGYNNDGYRTMWRWRDGVIRSFNENLPYDRFIVEQLAGDLLPDATLAQQIASGFNRNHVTNSEDGIIDEEYRVEYVADRVATTSTVFLGLSMGCARCHDHKFDPLTRRDYYRMFAFFNQVPEKGQIAFKGNPEPRISAPTAEQQVRLAQLEAERETLERRTQQLIADLPDAWEIVLDEALAHPDARLVGAIKWVTLDQLGQMVSDAPYMALVAIPRDARTAGQQRQLQIAYLERFEPAYAEIAAARRAADEAMMALNQQIPSAMVMHDMAEPRDTYLLKRGQYDQPDLSQKLEPGVPECLPPLPADAPRNRLGLAQWLTLPNHPLTARVTVNRYWQMYFGVGLVETAEDFGSQGEWPLNLELLDWLSTEFIASGWDVKHLQRLIVTSSTYRQASEATREARERDPHNRLLSRGPRFRLAAEAIRDNALAISGLLHEGVGGPSVSPYQPDGLWDDVSVVPEFGGTVFEQDHGAALYRRSIYTFWKRTCPPPGLNTFDAPEREVCVVRRTRTNTPLQALALENDPTYLEAARVLAERAMTEGGTTPATRLAYAFRLATARAPSDAELCVLGETFARRLTHYREDSTAALAVVSWGEAPRHSELDVAELAAYSVVASMILNLDETINKG